MGQSDCKIYKSPRENLLRQKLFSFPFLPPEKMAYQTIGDYEQKGRRKSREIEFNHKLQKRDVGNVNAGDDGSLFVH